MFKISFCVSILVKFSSPLKQICLFSCTYQKEESKAGIVEKRGVGLKYIWETLDWMKFNRFAYCRTQNSLSKSPLNLSMREAYRKQTVIPKCIHYGTIFPWVYSRCNTLWGMPIYIIAIIEKQIDRQVGTYIHTGNYRAIFKILL